MRFEDILAEPKRSYLNLMKFLLNKENLDGTVIEKIIDLAVGEQAPQLYKPR